MRNEVPIAANQATRGRWSRRRVRALVGLFAATLIALPVALITHPSASHATQTQDEILFVSKKSSANFVEFKSASGTITDQSIGAGGGGCSTPVFGGTPFLNVGGASYYNTTTNAAAYPAGAYPSGSPSSAGIGFSSTNMGVACDNVPSQQGSQIEPGEDLIFSVGNNSVDAGRPFTRVQLALTNADLRNPTSGVLVESLNGTVEGTTPFTIDSGLNQLIDSGVVNTGFNQLEVRVTQNSAGTAAISATWPSTKDPLQTTFYFPGQLPPGGSATTQVTDPTTGKTLTETITNTGSTPKNFADFSAVFTSTSRQINFSALAGSTDSFTAVFDWGDLPNCAPGPGAPENTAGTSGTSPANTCGYPTFTVNNVTQTTTFCASPPTTANTWCVFDEHFVYETVTSTSNTQVQATHITESWDGLGDILYHH